MIAFAATGAANIVNAFECPGNHRKLPFPLGDLHPIRKFTNIVAVLFFFINCVNATIHVAIRPPVVE